MEDKTKDSNDQASELRQLLDEVENSNEQERQHKENEPIERHEPNVDILNLPPRKEVHSSSDKRTKLKISSASKRLISVITVLLVLFFVMFYLWGDELMELIGNM